MSNSRALNSSRGSSDFVLLNPLPKHFEQIQDLCRKVYPFSKPWSIAQLESHRSYFPDGQLIVVERKTGRVVGLAFSLIIVWNDYSPQDGWQDFTSGGFFHNHNPRVGKTLYGAEVMVDPEYRGRGIGKILYMGRIQIANKYKLKRIRAGARLRGYSRFQDKYTPEEYIAQVVDKKLSDPTLSFQLSQGFKVIDVARNYLFNDPESLGYAAVIEWLNPKFSTEEDTQRQSRSVDLFLSGGKFVPHALPRELRHLVRKATSALGKAIQDLDGPLLFRKIETYREQLKTTRNKKLAAPTLKTILTSLQKESRDDLFKIAHAFTLQLEVVNACEAAYRTWRQQQKPPALGLKHKLPLTYVLTAHPTEARTKAAIETLASIQKLLVAALHNKLDINNEALATLSRILWMQSISRDTKPSVVDEAESIFSLVLSPETLDFILREKTGYDLKLRTWVGGDKDGHPGVDKTVMKECLSRSRRDLINYAIIKLNLVLTDLTKLDLARRSLRAETDAIKTFVKALENRRTIGAGDGTRIKTWTVKFRALLAKANPFVREHEQIQLLKRLLEVFPGFVLPLELREDAGQIKDALRNPKAPIREMLAELSKIAGALSITAYARGLVISHCEREEDLSNACALVDITIRNALLPAIPLFETRGALESGRKILKSWLKTRKNFDRVHRHWNRRLEVMLGYSDSAKEIGVLPSRLLIAKAMRDIDRSLRGTGVIPHFFHGSGGSVARGGGSLKEQISWWSASAIESPKMTIQGEMIQRLFASKEILNSHCVHLTTEAQRRKFTRLRPEITPELEILAHSVTEEYRSLVNNPALLGALLAGTPYRYLDALKLGSRPSKRPTELASVSSLRAIPWVLCWTQTRVLLPSWWGVGTAWSRLRPAEREKLKAAFLSDPFFSSFVKTLGFTLAKVELDVWELYYADASEKELIRKIRHEHEMAVAFVHDVSRERQLLGHRPWLDESIRLRAPHVHILNLIQILAMKRTDANLLRETIVGIACGMLTTG